MIVSWQWLQDYVQTGATPDEFAARLMFAGLNHEETVAVGDDQAIDLEVTSNRPDCLGHLGIAREAAVLFGVSLKIPAAQPPVGKTNVAELTSVTLTADKLCPRYTARVIRGVKVGPSPAWLVKRLATLGIAAVNNIVDITNYVLMECGQPLHAFDLAKLAGRKIIVREATEGEEFVAINHKTYKLERGMCVIADERRAVALGGVMGGADTEVSTGTTDLLIEAAEFDSMSIRSTARKLNLHSDSSYRFERALDPAGVDWASRRCCELILEIAGGELAAGVADAGRHAPARNPVSLRLPQIPRVLGIDIPKERVVKILTGLGCTPQPATGATLSFTPPSWRRDLEREIDLIEEVARVNGYDAIPEDVRVPMAPSQRSQLDRVLSNIRHTLTATGFDEALTLSVVEPELSEAFTAWTAAPPLTVQTPILRRATCLRRSLIPSLLAARRTNEALANPRIELFETAKVYWPQAEGLPTEPCLLALTSGGDYLHVKGALEALVQKLHSAEPLTVCDFIHELFERGKSVELRFRGERLGFIGELSKVGLKKFELRGATTVAELQLDPLVGAAQLIPRAAELSPFPAVTRDLNLVVAESVAWADVAASAQQAAGGHLEKLNYLDTYRDEQRLGSGLKSLLFSLILRSKTGTLTSEEADAVRDRVVAACGEKYAAKLRA